MIWRISRSGNPEQYYTRTGWARGWADAIEYQHGDRERTQLPDQGIWRSDYYTRKRCVWCGVAMGKRHAADCPEHGR